MMNPRVVVRTIKRTAAQVVVRMMDHANVPSKADEKVPAAGTVVVTAVEVAMVRRAVRVVLSDTTSNLRMHP